MPPWLAHEAGARGIGRFIDHTLLKPEATRDQILALCDEGRRFGVKAVCVNGVWARLCTERLSGARVALAVVAGFPLGAMASSAKAEEARRAVAEGATEIDMVLHLGAAKSGDWDAVEGDIGSVVEAAGSAIVKVILETAALEPDEIVAASERAVRAGARFVKTSTGFHPAGGATVEAVRLMRRTVGPDFGVKASGGVRTAEAAIAMLRAGANRIGTSGTAAMQAWLGPESRSIEELVGRD